LAQDLQALRAVPEVDRVGTMARITAVESQANTLPLKGVLAGQRSEKSSPAPGSAWSRAWRYVVNSLSELFVVHRLDADSQVVSLDMQALRRQHFSMLAFSARHAVLRSDQAAFHDAVEQMQAILAQHYAESAATDAASGALGELLAVNIAPKLPNVNGAAQLLKSGAGAQ
jgi:uroporphyrin-3 C-methyltransferase